MEPNAVPFALSLPIYVPLNLGDKAQAELESMVEMGVISEVTRPTPRCAGMDVVPKPQGQIWLSVDLTHNSRDTSSHQLSMHSPC